MALDAVTPITGVAVAAAESGTGLMAIDCAAGTNLGSFTSDGSNGLMTIDLKGVAAPISTEPITGGTGEVLRVYVMRAAESPTCPFPADGKL